MLVLQIRSLRLERDEETCPESWGNRISTSPLGSSYQALALVTFEYNGEWKQVSPYTSQTEGA